ncbi:MAG TPA: LysM peptidoglycan-binding domain-containing protein [Acholeplasmataceae bacterium]|jgi:N-acetylmuramoyl-L-alanine amidase|nr:LysM peptidoglycan-binding domain-containing protein [Acholeplasmataceae bacterium]
MQIIIDPGHGGFDPGGGSNHLWTEKSKTLQISQYQKRRYDELGIPAVMTRTGDEFLPPNARINRINELAGSEPSILISNHINSSGSKGAEVIYSIHGDPTLPNMIADQIRARGQNIRNVYTRTNYAGDDFYFVIREPVDNVQGMIVEYGFSDNPADKQILTYRWEDLAEAVVEAVAQYLGYDYFEPTFVVYRVQEGDSLFTIANKFNTTTQHIRENNGLTSDNLFVGQELYIYPG